MADYTTTGAELTPREAENYHFNLFEFRRRVSYPCYVKEEFWRLVYLQHISYHRAAIFGIKRATELNRLMAENYLSEWSFLQCS